MADFSLQIEIDPQTGALRKLADPELDMTLLHYRGGDEIEINGRPAPCRLVEAQQAPGEHLATLDVQLHSTYMAGQRLQLRRQITLGGAGLHTGSPHSVHLRYELRRQGWVHMEKGIERPWGNPIEAPMFLETLGVLGGRTDWFGPQTRMRAVAIGGSGPREHVSYEDGPIAEVSQWLRSAFRSAFPGQMTIAGAMYYHPEDERWMWVIVRRPHTGGTIEFDEDRQAFRFAYFKPMGMSDEAFTPEVSIFWGRGLDESDQVLAEQFDQFVEPPDWWYHTAWFWLHPIWQRGGSLAASQQAVEILSDECGVKGYGLASHDVPWAGRDIDPRSLRTSASLGGDDQIKRLADAVRQRGGHSYVWFTRTALSPGGDLRDDWVVRGIDGKPLGLQPEPGQGVNLQMLDNADPGVRDYLFAVIEHYVTQLGITGIFWDSGLQPMPPDFVQRDALNHPGEAMAAPIQFYRQVYDFGRSLSDDFFMWHEGISTEARSNGFAVDSRTHGINSGHALMHRIAHRGPRRLVWRSAWAIDVAGAMPFIRPTNDVGASQTPEHYRKIAADPINRWLCRTLEARGCRQARGVADGVAVLDEYLIAGHKIEGGRVVVPEALASGRTLVNELDQSRIEGEAVEGGVAFDVPGCGAWKMG